MGTRTEISQTVGKGVNFLAGFAFATFILIFSRMKPQVLISPIFWIVVAAYFAVLSWASYLQWKRGFYKERLGPMKTWEKTAIMSLPLALAIYWLVFNPPMPIVFGAAAVIVTVESAFARRQWRRKRQEEQQRDHV